MIATREAVRAAVARALLLDPSAGQQSAIEAAAQALGLPAEAVHSAIEELEPEPMT